MLRITLADIAMNKKKEPLLAYWTAFVRQVQLEVLCWTGHPIKTRTDFFFKRQHGNVWKTDFNRAQHGLCTVLLLSVQRFGILPLVAIFKAVVALLTVLK